MPIQLRTFRNASPRAAAACQPTVIVHQPPLIGETVASLTKDFHAAVDHYLKDCEATGRPPHKPYSGKLMLRVPPEVHAHAALMAEAHGKSINQWAAEVLAQAS